MAQLSFDSSTVAPQEALTPIPAGIYTAQIVESDIAPTKSGAGQALKLTFQVLDGQFVNRKVWTQLNIRHSNSDTERIAQSQLSAICHAVGVPRVQDSVQLHNKPMRIRVVIRKDETGQYGDRNEVKGFEGLPRGGAPISVTPGAVAAAPAAGPATPPWQRKAA